MTCQLFNMKAPLPCKTVMVVQRIMLQASKHNCFHKHRYAGKSLIHATSNMSVYTGATESTTVPFWLTPPLGRRHVNGAGRRVLRCTLPKRKFSSCGAKCRRRLSPAFQVVKVTQAHVLSDLVSGKVFCQKISWVIITVNFRQFYPTRNHLFLHP